jgi:hypothetical protein
LCGVRGTLKLIAYSRIRVGKSAKSDWACEDPVLRLRKDGALFCGLEPLQHIKLDTLFAIESEVEKQLSLNAQLVLAGDGYDR